jgi:hypothetical protein
MFLLIYLIVAVIIFVLVENQYLHCIHLCSVSFIACVVLCAVFCLSVVCYFVWCVLFVCCVLLQYHFHRVETHSQFK